MSLSESESASYTAALANEPSRHHSRTAVRFGIITLLPKSSFLDKYIIGPLSLFTGIGITTVLTTGYLSLTPSILFSKYIMKWPSIFNLPSRTITSSDGNGTEETNTSNTIVGSITAIKPLYVRSLTYLMQNGGMDFIAPLLAKHVSLFGNNLPGSLLLSHVYTILTRWNFYLTGRMFADQLAENFMSKRIKFGETGMVHARTCWFDDVVDSFVKKQDEKEEGGPQTKFNVVILGAGYDTRCYRLKSIIKNDNAKLYEVDAAGSQRNKKQSLRDATIDASHVTFVSCDFERQDWMKVLQSTSDFDASLPSIFIWEGVCYYLDREVVMSTISKVTMCGKGSCIAFDYFDEWCLAEWARKSTKRVGEPWKFAIEDVDEFVIGCNEYSLAMGGVAPSKDGGGESTLAVLPLRITDHLRCEEMKRRYIAKWNGRYIAYLEEFGGCLLLGS